MLHIRRATLDDIPLLQHMAITSYRHHFAHLWKNPDELAHFLTEEYGEAALQRSLSTANCVWLIASAGEPVGFAKYTRQQRIESDNIIGTLLHKLYLMPGETGKNYGEQIFSEVSGQAKASEETHLWLEVLADNPRARRFYQRLGMKHIKDITFTTATQTSTLNILAKML
ncbi:GNAT family N-acetyltransferase [Kluyvera cryocrescens]|uniref:GNAT family N-acetyltransferase n=1 Tax=Kluyvera cryocrescens TaxID=580 RepID=UPI0028BE2671|nr:GNAT family N-acetyltransferase [Kluyvera cryocrescens]WNN71510.1 GNAT family N-acetyltransferase [Kluyvera cryocrescens]